MQKSLFWCLVFILLSVVCLYGNFAVQHFYHGEWFETPTCFLTFFAGAGSLLAAVACGSAWVVDNFGPGV